MKSFAQADKQSPDLGRQTVQLQLHTRKKTSLFQMDKSPEYKYTYLNLTIKMILYTWRTEAPLVIKSQYFNT